MSLAAKLRALSEAATPGPWATTPAASGTAFIPSINMPYSSILPRTGANDAALIVTLRNAAPALVALVEAVEAVKVGKPFTGPGGVRCVCVFLEEASRVVAALAALEAK